MTNPIVRIGTASATSPHKMAIFPIAATTSTTINTTAGLAGPGAIAHPSSLFFTP